MIGIAVAIVILSLIVALGLTYAGLCFEYDENGGELYLRILFFRFVIYSGKPPKIKKRKYKNKRFARALAKRNEKAAKKKEKSGSADGRKTEKKKDIRPKDLVSEITGTYGEVIKRFPRYLKIDCARLVISVGGSDAHETALSYGATIQSVQYLITLLRSVTGFSATKNAVISVYPDFAGGKWKAECKFCMKLRIFHIALLGLKLFFSYLGGKKKSGGKNTATV